MNQICSTKEAGWSLITEVRKRFKNNLNWIAVITGSPGSGKSYTAMKIGEFLDPDFSIENVAFTAEEFLELVDKAPDRSIIVVDEAGVQNPSRRAMSANNVALGFISQTFRFRQLGVIWALPDLGMVDLQIRKLFHTFMECTGIDRKTNESIVKVFDVNFDKWSGKIIHKYPRSKGGKFVITSTRFPKPSEKLLEEYETRKADAFHVVLEEAKEMVSGGKNKKERQNSKQGGDMKKLDYRSELETFTK